MLDSEEPALLVIDIDLLNGIDVGAYRQEAAATDIDMGVGSGLNADRVLQLITDLKTETLASIRALVLRIVGAEEVRGVKITLDSVEIGAVQTKDLVRLQSVITETLDELANHRRAGEE
ncbi:MAG: hypothetical protein V2I43_19660 [Parvularcula sp.]|jgi:hypothetical protein|nr:hypothetical protein [Parvularcula sp.]